MVWGTGWILKGLQLRLQESLASSAPVCSTHHTPPPFLLLLPARQALAKPLQAFLLLFWGAVWTSGYHSGLLFPTSPGEWDWGMSSDPLVLCPFPAGVGTHGS